MDQYEPLAQAITLISRDADVARDAVQEAFVRLCREWPTVSGYRHQAAWVRKVALNLVRDQQRRSGRRVPLFVSLEQMGDDPVGLGSHGLASDDFPADGNPQLWRAVRQLPDKQRTAVGLFYIADLKVSRGGSSHGRLPRDGQAPPRSGSKHLANEHGGLVMWGRDLDDYVGDEELRAKLKRLVPAMPPARAWPKVQARAQSGAGVVTTAATRGIAGEAETASSGAAPKAAKTRLNEGRPVNRDGRHRSAFAYAAISFAVLVLLGGLGTGIFEAVTRLGKEQPILVITDDTLDPATPGQTTQTTQGAPTIWDGTWQQVPLSVDGGSVSVLVMDPTDPAVLYATTDQGPLFATADQGPYKSTDGGVTWTPVSAEQSARMIVVDPGSPSTVYRIISGSGGVESAFTGGDGALYTSVDGGSTWTKVSERPGYPDHQMWPWWQLLIDPSTTPSTLYGVCPVYWANPGTRLFKSTDGGHTWEDLTDELAFTFGVSHLAIDAAHHTVYVNVGDGLVRSSDGGATWEDLSAGLPAGLGSASAPGSRSGLAVFLDPRDPSRLYL